MRLNHAMTLPTAAFLTMLGLACTASAQTAGVYSGTSQDGQNVSFTVADDGSGNLSINSVNVGIAATCMPGGTAFNTGWGYNPQAAITKNKVSYVDSFQYLYEKVTGTFSGDTFSGKILSYTPTFAPTTKSAPSKAVFCTSPSQTFTATLQSSGTMRQPAHINIAR